MSKNPSIESELSQVLDEFLEKLGECDKYLQNGIFNMNFAEAALLLQSSADLYGKKVDMLWDVLFDYQKRLLLSEEQNGGDQNQEIEKVEERKRKYKRKRKSNSDESQTSKLVNSFSFGNAESVDYLNQNCEVLDLSKEWEKFHTKNACDSVQGPCLNKPYNFLPNNSVRNEDNDYIGRYDQFHSMSLTEEIFHLESQNLLADDHNSITKMRIDSYVINDFFLEKGIPSTTPPEKYCKELQQYINEFFESNNRLGKESSMHTQSLTKESHVSLERLSFGALRDKRASLADSLFEDDHIGASICSTPCLKDQQTCDGDEVSKNLENRSKSCSQDSAFFEDEELMRNESDNEAEPAAEKGTPEADSVLESTSMPPEAASVEAVMSEVTVEHSYATSEAGATSEQILEPTVATRGKEDMMTTRGQPLKKWCSLLEASEEDEEPAIKRKKLTKKMRISAKALEKLASGVTVSQRDFESFCRRQYKAANGEGVVPPQSDSDDSDEDLDDMSNDEDAVSDHEMSVHEEENDENPEEEQCDEPTDLPPTMSPLHLPTCGMTSTPRHPDGAPHPSFVVPEADFERDDSCRQSVRRWRSFIVPKLKSLENRADFDIHEYGAKIIEPSAVGEQRHFKDVVRGKSAAEVARYFIATLQLANTYNVEITGTVQGEVANDTFQIRTLDKTKHHELLEEYQAPSEETFKERLERAQAMNPKVSLSFRDGEPLCKKRKLGSGSRKRLF